MARLQSPEIHEGAKRRLELEAPSLSGNVTLLPKIAPGTSTLTVSGRGTTGEYTRLFVDAAVQELGTLYKREQGGVPDHAASDSSANLPNARADLEAKQRELQVFLKTNDMASWRKTSEASASYLNDLRTERARLVDDLQRLRAAAGGDLAASETRLKDLDVSITIWSKKVQEAVRMDAEYKRLQSAVTRAEEQQEKGSKARVDSSPNSGLRSAIPTVVHQASPPMPVPKRVAEHLLLGLFEGLLAGGLILILLDRADDRLASSSELLAHFTEPILAQIPNVAETGTPAGLALVQVDDDRYAYAEAFRSLRASLIFMPNQAGLKTLVITSSIPNEGRSTIASNLALTMAESGARVLLVDADLRHGDLAARFDTNGRFGLSSILRDEIPWESVVQTTRCETLSLIPRGPVTDEPGALLLKPALVSLIGEFKAAYDLVIFNTAPILATDDTSTLAPHLDGTLVIVRAQFTSARLTHNALDALYQRQVNVLGLILNSVDTELPDYYYYRYPKYFAA